jgi:hypothetical protein
LGANIKSLRAEMLTALGLCRARRRSAMRYGRLAYRGDRDSPGALFSTRFAWLNAAGLAVATAAEVVKGDALTDRSRRFVVTVTPTERKGVRHVVWSSTRSYLPLASVVAIGFGAAMAVCSPVRGLEGLVVGAGSAASALAAVVVVISFVSWLPYVLSPHRRRERRLVKHVWNQPVPVGSSQPEHVWVVGSFAGQPGPSLLAGLLRRKVPEFADTHKCAFVAIAVTKDRVKRYRKVGEFQVVFTHPKEPAKGSTPSEWYLARYPRHR